MGMVPFNKPYLTGKEISYIREAVHNGKLSGNGIFTQRCQRFFEENYHFGKCLLTTSCTDALEMCAMLLNIQPGDEVIMPSYTFVSTALAFVRQGAKIVFADSHAQHPGIDENNIEALITGKTKAVVPVHYAGISCNMEAIMDIAGRHNLFVVEDAAPAIDSFYNPLTDDAIPVQRSSRPLGSIGHLAAFSFHETKNIQCGEGGMLVINDERFFERAEIIWEKGTNRSDFFRGRINKYGWTDVGSSFLPSEITAAFLWAQIENINSIQSKRKSIWNSYSESLKPLAEKGRFILPEIPGFATVNGQQFHLVCNSTDERTKFIDFLKLNGISAVFHYQGLHNSPYYANKHDGRLLPECDRYSGCLIRLPLFYELGTADLKHIISTVKKFYD